jgi:hypothetical protein
MYIAKPSTSSGVASIGPEGLRRHVRRTAFGREEGRVSLMRGQLSDGRGAGDASGWATKGNVEAICKESTEGRFSHEENRFCVDKYTACSGGCSCRQGISPSDRDAWR